MNVTHKTDSHLQSESNNICRSTTMLQKARDLVIYKHLIHLTSQRVEYDNKV